MNAKRIGISAVAAITLAVAGCSTGGSSNDTVDGNAVVTIQATAPGSLVASVRSASARAAGDPMVFDVTGGSMTLTTVRFVLKEFEIELVGEDADGTEFEMEGPYVVDLIQQTVDPAPGALDLLPGTYDEIKFKIDKIEGDEDDEAGAQLVAAADPLFGHSMLIVGSFTPTAGAAIPFTYTYDGDAEFELSGGGDGFTVSDADVSDIVIAFRVARWFDGIADLSDFAANPDDGAYKEALKEAIKGSADYGEDEDDDGVLESDEDDDPDGAEDEDD